MLETGRIIELSAPPKVVNPLSVSENSDKKRLILDLRYVNAHVWKEHVKFEDFKVLKGFIHKDCHMFNFDFKSGYHHVEIFEEHWEFLGFAWSFKGKKRFFCFVVLPFGLCSAGRIFTKVCRVLVKHWRRNGIKIVIYIDDGIGTAKSLQKCEWAAKFVKLSIEKSGFIINAEKSNWVPSQRTKWLGLEIDSHSYTIKITQKRVDKVLAKVDSLLTKRRSSARELSSIAGAIISQEVVMGAITGLFTRDMYACIAKEETWDRKFPLTTEVINELVFWKENIVTLNLKEMGSKAPPLNGSVLASSDASSVASGAVLTVRGQTHQAHKNLSPKEATHSSTWRELDAIAFAVESFAPLLREKTVIWATDNQAAPIIAEKGSNKPHLQNLAKDLYFQCRHHSIDLKIHWIPRELNIIADEISKQIDYDDWATSEEFFNNINAEWGPFDIDRFANYKNAKTARFNSRHWNPKCEAVDAFTQDWKEDNNWVVPPIYLISQAINHARVCQATGAIIVPYWESAPYWPLLRKNTEEFRKYVINFKVFHDTKGILEIGDYRKSLLGSSRFTSPILAIKFQF